MLDFKEATMHGVHTTFSVVEIWLACDALPGDTQPHSPARLWGQVFIALDFFNARFSRRIPRYILVQIESVLLGSVNGGAIYFFSNALSVK